MPIFSKTYYLLLILLLTFSCGDDPAVTPEPEPPASIKAGLSWSLEEADADKELTIWFKAASGSPLYNYTGDVYIHTGVISEGEWQFVPAEWNENLSKCKMTKVEGEQSTWTIKLTPSIRQWYGSGKTAVNQLGIVVRSADGSKQTEDLFIPVTDTQFKAFEPAAVKSEAMPSGLLHGINIVDNSTVTLVLYDKDKNGTRKDFAHVIGDFNNWTLSNDEKSQMLRDDATGCWWITISGLNPAKEYAFQYYTGKKDTPIRVADPYARKILDPWNDRYISSNTYPNIPDYPQGAIGIVSVFQTQPETYTWQVPAFEIPSRDNLVIYEMLLRDFTASGNINGVMEKLDYLQFLGVNAIELMPVQEFDGNDSWGYNPAFFFAMDKAYGTDKMYKQFIDECHQRGIAVILDVVYNHATGENPFAKMWWDSANNRTAANNPYFNVTAPHPYSVFHDFNHESELVREFIKRNLQFLLEEYKIDGFRFDLTKGFTQKQSTESNAHVYDASRIAILKDYNKAIKEVKQDALVILEHFADDAEETELSNAGTMVWRNMNHAYCQTAMGYKEESGFSGTYYGTSSRPTNSLVSYMESHDEERAGYKQSQWGFDILKTDLNARMSQLATNAAFFFTVPGPKMIWQFGELGYDISIDENGRTGKKPVKWEYLDVPQRKELHDTYAKLIALRFDHPELFNATADFDWEVTPSFWEKGRFITLSSFGGVKQLVVIGNFTNGSITTSVEFPGTGTWYNYMNPGETISVTSATMNITVPTNSFKMYTNFAE
ncbi:MAG: alpha-amylase family glycosyl hydrolase [Proteiniphilum sp.]|uniref:alpha-amylase family glycosyl hydrolase n=1 Tax=Proteiniphilum sp. TaxID=1926877 RepID=UPI002B20A3EF|nr:alpha-amylase family glycosyl hydrolase [Proteiniphilum sp.]MEA5128218.1 alpha-amylase family glycosyl hydrolase [Proteiniphilum sp.]